jgi:hypothetical protein
LPLGGIRAIARQAKKIREGACGVNKTESGVNKTESGVNKTESGVAFEATQGARMSSDAAACRYSLLLMMSSLVPIFVVSAAVSCSSDRQRLQKRG